MPRAGSGHCRWQPSTLLWILRGSVQARAHPPPRVCSKQRHDAADQGADSGHNEEHHAPALHSKRPLPAHRRRQEPRKPAWRGRRP